MGQMQFNEGKCKVLHFVRNNNDEYKYTLNNVELTSCNSEQDIGVIINCNLKPSEHINRMVAKANGMLWQLSRAFPYKPKNRWIKLYKTYIRPLLEYSSPVWNPWCQADKDKIENVQIRALRQCTEMNDLTYEQKLAFDQIQVRKIMNKKDNVKFETWFKKHEPNERLTRLRADNKGLQISAANL